MTFKSIRIRKRMGSELYVALKQQYITRAACQDVNDHAGRTITHVADSDGERCLFFIKYLLAYEQGQWKKNNPER